MDSIKKQLQDHNTDVAIIPRGLTSQLQPLDVSLNKPFKEKVRAMWSAWMADDEKREFTKGGKLKKSSITLWCKWILRVWEQVDLLRGVARILCKGVSHLYVATFLLPLIESGMVNSTHAQSYYMFTWMS